MKRLDGVPIIKDGKNTVRHIQSNTMEKSRLEDFFHVPATKEEVNTQ